MISLLTGKLCNINDNYATIITNSGVGYLVGCTKSLLITNDSDAPNQEITAHIQTIVRDDEIALYGFVDEEERAWFNKLLSVQGVGAKMALLILNNLSAAEIVNSLAAQDHTVFQQISGIGPKLAKRLINEINVKDIPASALNINTQATSTLDKTVANEAEQALVSLGFAKHEVKNVLSKAPANDSFNQVEELIKYSLGQLTAKKLAK